MEIFKKKLVHVVPIKLRLSGIFFSSLIHYILNIGNITENPTFIYLTH